MIRTAALRACRAWSAASRKISMTIPSTTTATITTKVASKTLSRRFSHSALSTFSRDEGVKWRFPVDDWTQAMVTSIKHGQCLSTMFTFNSKKPITPDLMEEALIHLYSKVESLRLCFRLRDEQLWFADMPQQKIDFQVVSSTDLEHEHDKLRKVQYDLHNGPLWNARLMTCPPDAPCPLIKVKAAYPHQCHLLMCLHHAANDGIVIHLLSQLLPHILDSLLEGSPVDTEPVGELRDRVEARKEEGKIREQLVRDPEMLLVAIRKHLMNKHLPLLMEAYGIPNEANSTTKFLQPLVINKQVLEKLASKSRSIGATLNTCFIAILNMSMMEVALEAGLERDIYNISSLNAVNGRRLIENCKSLPLGYHFLRFVQCTSTPRNVKKNFWQYVQGLDTELRTKLNRNYMCEERVLERLLRPEGFTHETEFINQSLPDCDYFFSNVYSPKLSHYIGENVQLTQHRYYWVFHKKNYPVAHGLYSNGNQVILSTDYSTRGITSEVANKYYEKLESMLHDVSNMAD